MNEMITKMQDQDVVGPHQAHGGVLVPKKDGSILFCLDYRRLNAITKKDVYPLQDDILDDPG